MRTARIWWQPFGRAAFRRAGGLARPRAGQTEGRFRPDRIVRRDHHTGASVAAAARTLLRSHSLISSTTCTVLHRCSLRCLRSPARRRPTLRAGRRHGDRDPVLCARHLWPAADALLWVGLGPLVDRRDLSTRRRAVVGAGHGQIVEKSKTSDSGCHLHRAWDGEDGEFVLLGFVLCGTHRVSPDPVASGRVRKFCGLLGGMMVGAQNYVLCPGPAPR